MLKLSEIWDLMQSQQRINDELCAFINREMKMTAADPRLVELEKIIHDVPLYHGYAKLSPEVGALLMGDRP